MNRLFALIAALLLALTATSAFADPPNPNENAEKDPVETGCNANNPNGGGCPEGAGGHGRDDGKGAVCGNGKHTGNPHCEEAETVTPPTNECGNNPECKEKDVTNPPAVITSPPVVVSPPTVVEAAPPPQPPSNEVPTSGPSTEVVASSVSETVVASAGPAAPVTVVEASSSPILTLPAVLPRTGAPFPVAASGLVGLALLGAGWLLRRS